MSEADIQRRLETYRRLYPDNPIRTHEVKAILLAEAYLDRQGIRAGKDDADRAKDLKPEDFPGEAGLERAKEALKARTLFAREEIRSGGRKLRTMDQVRKQLGRRPPPESWPADGLRIPGAPGECVARLEAECYVTVEEFNAAAGQFQFPKDLPLDSARTGVLRRYALAKRSAGKKDAGEAEEDEETLLASYRMNREGSRWLGLSREFGYPEMDAKVLEATYHKYHRRYFRARDEVTLALVGSSDSGYIDSLHAVLAGWRKAAVSREGAPSPAVGEPSLPWLDFKEEDLPPELTAPTDTFRVGDFTAPIRTPYGFFLVRLSRVTPVKEVSFQEAYGKLVYLATRDNFLDLDSLAEAKMKQIYERNHAEFSLPDTLELRAWLAPAEPGRPAGAAKTALLPPDTSRFRSLRVSSLDLPRTVRVELQEAARKDSRTRFFGPFPGPYGRWHFAVMRAGRAEGFIPYSVARRAIRERLSGLPGTTRDTSVSDAAKDKVMLNLALAQRRSLGHEKSLHERVSGELADRLRRGDIDTAGFPDEAARRQGLHLARTRLEEEIRSRGDAEERRFLGRLRIDFGRSEQSAPDTRGAYHGSRRN